MVASAAVQEKEEEGRMMAQTALRCPAAAAGVVVVLRLALFRPRLAQLEGGRPPGPRALCVGGCSGCVVGWCEN